MRFLLRFLLSGWALLGAGAACARAAEADPTREIAGHLTVRGAEASTRPNPVPVRHVFGADRDWVRQPFRIGVVLVEFADRAHEPAHSATLYEKLLFSRDEYHRQPDGTESFGSVADWYRVQSHGSFVLTGRVFDWVKIDETFDAIHAMKLAEARAPLFQRAVERVEARDGPRALEGYDGLIFIHAGPITGPTNNILWSHQGQWDGRRYFTTGEIERIGVFCHEWGHVIGLPDLYGKAGVRESFGPWCAMASGYRGLYPKSFCVWSKTRLGWCRPTVIEAGQPQKLVLRPIQAHPDDAFVIPLNDRDGAGAEFLMLENRSTAGNDAEGQAGLFIWRITRLPDSGGLPRYELKLPGPADRPGADLAKRRVAWPGEGATEFTVSTGQGTVSLRRIRREGDLVYFELGAK